MSWKMAGHPKGYKCTMVEIGLPDDAKGRVINGIIEIPSNGWFTNNKKQGPYTFRWVNDEHCGDETFDELEGQK